MPTVVFASPKGGVGKTTSLMTFAATLAESNTPTTIIDADPTNRHIQTWAERYPDHVPDCFTILTDPGERQMPALIDEVATKTPFVLIDVHGSAAQLQAKSIGRADLVLVPMRPTQMDAEGAAAVIELIRDTEADYRRKIPFRIFLNNVNVAIRDREETQVTKSIQENEIPTLNTVLVNRMAFRQWYAQGPLVTAIDATAIKSIEDAKANARAFGEEIAQVLLESQEDEE